MTTRPRARLAILTATALTSALSIPEPPSTIFLGGTVITLAEESPVAEALAVREGRVVAAGSHEEVSRLAGPETVVVDLGGAVLLPAFVDHHVHLLNVGLSLVNAATSEGLYLDLAGSDSVAEIAERVGERAGSLPPGAWILGKGWNQEAWGAVALPEHAELSLAAPLNPVFLARTDGHAGWVNAAALEAAGLEAGTPDPYGGRILRDGDGSPSGMLLERAVEPVVRRAERPSIEQMRQAFRRAAEAVAARGVVETFDAGALSIPGIVDLSADFQAPLEALVSEALERPLPVRVNLMIPGPSSTMEQILGGSSRNLPAGLRVTHVKLFADGALGSRGAALSHAFEDDTSTHGVARMTVDEIREISRRALAVGLDVATHAIGDAAVARALDAYEALLAEDEDLAAGRLRIEHFSYASDEDIARAARLGVVLSVQPAFVAPDDSGETLEDRRLGAERAARACAWGRLAREGARMVGGTDDFGLPSSPLLEFYSAVTRQNTNGLPAGGWHPENSLSRLDALHMLTGRQAPGATAPVDAALRVGAPADIVVLSADPLSVPDREILEIEVLATIANGRVTYHNGHLPGLDPGPAGRNR